MRASTLRGCFLGLTLILVPPVTADPEPGPDSPMVGSAELPSPESVHDPERLTRLLEVAADEAYRLALSEKHPADIFFWDPGNSDEDRVLNGIVAFRSRAESARQEVEAERSVSLTRPDRGLTHEAWRTFAPEDIGDGRKGHRITEGDVDRLREAADKVGDALDLTSMPRTRRYWILKVQPILARLEDLTAP